MPVAGSYRIDVTAWAEHDEGTVRTANDQFAKLEVVLEGDTESSVGAAAIKAKLAELHRKFLGADADADSIEVEAAFDLFVDVWQRSRITNNSDFGSMRCDWSSDTYYLEDVVEDAFPYREDWGDEWGARRDWDRERIDAHFETIDWSDPYHVARTWAVLLSFLMTDPGYLHL